MALYEVKVAEKGLSSSWLVRRAECGSAERAIDIIAEREVADGYEPIAFIAENLRDAHDIATRGRWPFLVDYYGCVQCQQYHYRGDALFSEHVMRQDKPGIRQGSLPATA